MRLLAVTCAVLGLTASSGAMAARPCLPVPEVARDIITDRYYGDTLGTQVDAGRYERHQVAIGQSKLFIATTRQGADGVLKLAIENADRISRHPNALVRAIQDSRNLTCTVEHLRAWAEGQGYLGRMSSKQAEAQRRFDLAGLALAYVKLRPFVKAADRAIIEPWLIDIADRARAVFDAPGIKRNNHWYWMGLGLGAVGHATGSKRHLDAARGIMQDAARDIAPDGTLRLEMARGARALHYHGFAAMALAPLAEIGAAHGEDWYQLNDGALHRLITTTTLGLADPTAFDRAAGIPQQRPPATHAGFLHIYLSRFPDRLAGIDLPTRQRPSHPYLGGNVVMLRYALGFPPKSPGDAQAGLDDLARRRR